jgi:hypothetical protein
MEDSKRQIASDENPVGRILNQRIAILGRLFTLKTLLIPIVMFSGFIGFMAFVQFSTPNLPDNDGFYHIKMAYLMRSEGLKPDFIWLPLSILNPREYYDHHFLFHVLLVPFTFGDLLIGAKWSAVIFASLAFLLVWRLLDAQKIPFAPVWAFGLLAVSEAFIYRMSITRAQSLSLALLALAVHWLLAGKQMRLLLLGFIYVWFYNAFPLLLAISGAYVLAVGILERRLDIRPLLFSGIGIAAGLVINPYFPYNLLFVVQHILPKLVETTAISVGNEWYPYTTGQLLSNSPFSLLAFISGALALGLVGKRMDVRTATVFFLACLFGLMMFQSRRFIEYFPPFALLFAAFAWTPFITSLHNPAARQARNRLQTMIWAIQPHAVAVVLVLVLVPGMWLTYQGAKDSIQGSKPYQLYAGASAWLETNTSRGERVFQTDWDDFPRLFFYNTHNTYLVGLDPTYMQMYDADLYDVWVEITRGRIENPSNLILKNFGARYIISDLLHEDFIDQAERDPHIQEMYRDEDAVVYQVIDMETTSP